LDDKGEPAAAASGPILWCFASFDTPAADMTTQRSNVQDWQTCLSEDVIVAFQSGETTAAERQHIHQHLDSCEHCRGLLLLATHLGETSRADTEKSSQRLAAFMEGGFRWMTFAQGQRLAQRFDILRFVQRGGMGEVYEAFDRVVGSRVALKTLLGTTAESAEAHDRQSREVNLARRVAHPHVCRIYDLHEHREKDQRPMRFLAMEFVDGETLKERLLASELTIAEACAIAVQLLQGLGAIHAAGVLHLDFKSHNVMLRSGAAPAQAVVMDFSLSRAFEKELRLRTSERQLAGSVGYMSPEQLECQATLGPASDVYAFGVVFFEMLTRRMPFEGESPTSIMLKQLKNRPAPPSSLRPGIGGALDDFVLTCLSRQPRGRFPSVESALSELERCMRRQAGRAPRMLSRRGRIALASALLAGALASLAALGHSLRQDGAASGRASTPAAAAPSAAPAAPGSGRAAEPPAEQQRTADEDKLPNLLPAPAAPPGGKRLPPIPATQPAAPLPAASPSRPEMVARRRQGPASAPAPVPAAESEPANAREPAREPAADGSGERELAAELGSRPAATPEPQPPDKPLPEQWKPERAPDFLLR